MPWLLPTLIAAASCIGLAALFYLVLYLRHRQAFLGLWSAAWACFGLNLAAAVAHNLLFWVSAAGAARLLFALASAWFILQGVLSLLGRPLHRAWLIASLAAAVPIALSPWWPAQFSSVTITTFLMIGALQVAAGGLMLRAGEARDQAQKTVGVLILLWGVQRAGFPLAADGFWAAPWGFALAAALVMSVAMGLLVVFFERLRREARLARDAAQANLHLMDTILGTAPVGIALARQRRMVWVNQAFQDFTGHDPTQWIGQETRKLFPSDQEFERVGRVIGPQLATTGSAEVESEMVMPNGDLMPIQLRMRAIDRSDPLEGYIVAVTSIAEIKAAQAELARVTRVLRAVGACHHALLHAGDESSLTEQVCRIICQEGGYRMAWVGMLDGEGRVAPLAHWGNEDGYLGQTEINASGDSPRGKGPMGAALRTGRPAVAQNVLGDSSFEPWRVEAAQRGYAAVAGLPLLSRGSAFGVLGIYAARPDAFDPGELDLLMDLANDLAFGLENLRAREARTQAEEALRASEEKYRSLVENVPGVVYRCLPAFPFATLFVSPGVETITGYPPAYFMGQEGPRWPELVDPGDRVRVERVILRAVAAGDPWEAEYRLLDKLGGRRWISDRGRALYDQAGRPLCLEGVIIDITQNKLAEEALRASEERYRGIVQTAQEGIWFADENYVTTFVNPRLLEMLGYAEDEMVGRPITWFMHEEELEDQQAKVRARRQARSEQFVRRFRRKRGDYIWALVSAAPVMGPGGEFQGSFAMLGDISERVAAEEALRASEERHRLLVESANEGIVVAQDGMVKFFNSRMLEITGFTAEEYASTPFIEHVHPDDRQRVMERHRSRAKGDASPNTDPFRIIDRQGRVKWLRPNGVLIEWEGRPATLGFFTDITEALQTQAALKESQERYRLISENTLDIVVLHDLDLRVLYASPSIAKTLGFLPEEVAGGNILDMLHPDDAKDVADILGALDDQSDQVLPKRENRVRAKAGDYLWMETLATPVRDSEGRVRFIQTSSRDISERKRAEEALRQLAAGVAHNFNNVLMAILSNAQFAQAMVTQGQPDAGALVRHLGGVVQGALAGRDVVQRLSRLVGPGPESPRIRRAVEVRGLLLSLRQMLEDTWPQIRAGRVGLSVEAGGESHVAGSAGEMMEVLLNLAKNAVEAMPEGGSLSVAARAEGERVFISVSDSGPGLAPEAQARLFEPFFSTKGVAGQGLGLAVSKAIIQAHGGGISVDSRPGRTTFTLSLPLAPPPAMDQPLPRAGLISPPLKVLLLEDEALVALGLTAILERVGHQVRHVGSLAQALAALKEFAPQVALCDLGLPDAEGWEVVTRLREALRSQGASGVPVVAISGWSGQQLGNGPGDAPAGVRLLQKPVEAGLLLETLAQVVA